MALTTRDLQLIRKMIREEISSDPFKNEMYGFRNEMYEFRNEIKNDLLQFKDDILHEIRGLREEITIVVGYRGMLENHEERLEVVENTLQISRG